MSPALARALCALFLALPPGRAAAEGAAKGNVEQSGARSDPGCPQAGAGQTAPLDLNAASESELLALPGVGPSKARAILDFRSQHGGFLSVSQLLRIKGFGRATLKRLRPFLAVSPLTSGLAPAPEGAARPRAQPIEASAAPRAPSPSPPPQLDGLDPPASGTIMP